MVQRERDAGTDWPARVLAYLKQQRDAAALALVREREPGYDPAGRERARLSADGQTWEIETPELDPATGRYQIAVKHLAVADYEVDGGTIRLRRRPEARTDQPPVVPVPARRGRGG